MAKSTAIVAPNLGLFYNEPPINIPAKGLKDGYNFRVKNGQLNNLNLGWSKFSDSWTLDGPVMKIDNFFPRELDEKLIFLDDGDAYLYTASGDTITYLTPQYDTGTAAATDDDVTGVGTLWSANVKAGDMIHFGDANYANPSGEWHEIDSVTNDTALVLVDPIDPLDDPIAAGLYTIRQKFESSTTSVWDTDIFIEDGDSGDDLWFATNGTDDVITWNGTDATVTRHPELGFVCQHLAVFANMMIYGNVNSGTDYPTSIINSDIGLPLHAGSTGTGLSEQFRVHDNSDAILEVRTLGNNLAIYSSRTLIIAQFIGDPFVFAFRIAAAGLGPLSSKAVADFGDFHEFPSRDGQYRFDGVSVQEINRHVWREIIRTNDPSRKFQIFNHFDEENGDLMWSVPSTTDAGSGTAGEPAETFWVEHYLEEVHTANAHTPFSKRAGPFTAMGYYTRAEGLTWQDAEGAWEEYNFAWNDQFFALAFPLNLAGDETGQVYILNNAQTGDGELLPSYVRFGRTAIGSTGREHSLLRRVYPFAGQLDSYLDVTAHMSLHASGTTTAIGPFELNTSLPEGGHFVSVFRRGRFMELEFGTDGEAWSLDGYDTDVTEGGLR